jgi:hypothetical protein
MSYLVFFCFLSYVCFFHKTAQAESPATEGPSLHPAGWAATYGGSESEYGESIQETDDGGYIVTGGTSSFGAGKVDVWVLKLGVDGSVDWQRSYGGSGWDVPCHIRQTSDGGYIVAGQTNSFGAGSNDIWVIKLRPYGTPEWQKTYGGIDGDMAHSIQQTSDGGYIVAGTTASFGVGTVDLWVLRLRSNGTLEWQKTYGGGNFDWGHSIQQTSDGGYIVAGTTSSFGAGEEDCWILKLRPDGTVEWQKTYGEGNWEAAYAVQQTRGGGYIVAGAKTTSFGAGGENIPDLWVLKLRTDGTVEWEKTYGEDSLYERAASIQPTSDGGYIVAGERGNVHSGTGTLGVWGTKAWILKLGSDGTVEWQKIYGGDNLDISQSVQQTGDGGYIMAGETYSFVPKGDKFSDLWVLKLKPDGSFGYAQNESITPACDFIGETSISGRATNAKVMDSSASIRNSDAWPQDSAATTRTTEGSAKMLCP